MEETDLIAAVKRLKNGRPTFHCQYKTGTCRCNGVDVPFTGIVDECACGDALFAMTPAGKLEKLRRDREEKKLKNQIDDSLSRSVRTWRRNCLYLGSSARLCLYAIAFVAVALHRHY